MRALGKSLILFGIGGFLYYLIECLWRGYSHWTMCIVGGICFLIVGSINEVFDWDMPIIHQMFYSSLMITIVEFFAGLLLNVILNLNIWDYSNMRFNLIGQICLMYSILWFVLSAAAIILDDYLRYWLFDEEKPQYKIF